MGFFKRKKKTASADSAKTTPTFASKPADSNALNSVLQENLQTIKTSLGESSDIVFREIGIGKEQIIKVGLIYTDGLTDTASLNEFILETLLSATIVNEMERKKIAEQNLVVFLKEFAMTVGEIDYVTTFDVLYTSLLSGDTIMLVDGYPQGLIISNRQWVERGVTEPTAQTVVRGPREGFSENLRINTALVRRKIKDPNLWTESKTIGKRTKTSVALMYMNGIVNEKIVEELHLRLDTIDIDAILESGNIEELIEDDVYSPFPTVFNTERPDVVAAALLEGRIAILVDGTPFVLIVPALFVQFFQSPEDYYQRADIASFVRFLRFVCFGISLLAPSLFIAVTTYHQSMLPPALLISLAAQREGTPFPAFFEALLMEFTFEILREAGVRMPRTIGSTMSIVGAFVIGTAAVEAGIISAAMVIVVSITAIASFVSPTYDIAIAVRLLRFGFMVSAAVFGLFGITVALIALTLHLCSLRSFGIPYMSPIGPFNTSDQKDTFFRFYRWKMITRPRLLNQKNIKRQQNTVAAQPKPPQSQE